MCKEYLLLAVKADNKTMQAPCISLPFSQKQTESNLLDKSPKEAVKSLEYEEFMGNFQC